ncbi:MAG TPA: hypothetical protein VFX59_16215 [Polyangiales bacterium]|nr:hypothetical protein [Polyangiales bacterium]
MKILPLALLCLVSMSCSSEPSEGDLTQALQPTNENPKIAAAAKSMGLNTELHGLKKLGCEKTEQDNAYLCDVEMDMTAPMVGRRKVPARLRAVSSDGRWVVVPTR